MSLHELQFEDPLWDLIKHCETACVIECCGIDALNVDADLIDVWRKQVGSELFTEAQRQLRGAISGLKETNFETIHCAQLNQNWSSKAEALTYFMEWERQLNKVC